MTEYPVLDTDKGSWRSARCESWRKAIELVYKRFGFLPRRHLDVRPRVGTGPTPSSEEFDEFMSKHF